MYHLSDPSSIVTSLSLTLNSHFRRPLYYIESTQIIQENLPHLQISNVKSSWKVPLTCKVTYYKFWDYRVEILAGGGGGRHYSILPNHSNHLQIHGLVWPVFLKINGNSLFVFNCVLILFLTIMFVRFTHIPHSCSSCSLCEYTINRQLGYFQSGGHYEHHHYEHCHSCILVHICTHFSKKVYLQEWNC